MNATVAGAGDRAVALHRFTAANPWGPAGTSNVTGGALTLALPARSATLAVIATPTTAVEGGAGVALALRAAPNPMRGDGALTFTLPRAGAVELAVFDAAGRRVRTLERGTRDAGVHTVRWDGRDERGRAVSSGLYLCRLEGLGRVATVRVLRLH